MGVILSSEGKKFIDIERKKRGYKKYDRYLQNRASVSEITLKRFWSGKQGIKAENFRAICEALGVDTEKNWDLLTGITQTDSTIVPDGIGMNKIDILISELINEIDIVQSETIEDRDVQEVVAEKTSTSNKPLLQTVVDILDQSITLLKNYYLSSEKDSIDIIEKEIKEIKEKITKYQKEKEIQEKEIQEKITKYEKEYEF